MKLPNNGLMAEEFTNSNGDSVITPSINVSFDNNTIYKFTPLESITAYELAIIFQAISCSMMFPTSLEALKAPEIIKHFTPIHKMNDTIQ